MYRERCAVHQLLFFEIRRSEVTYWNRTLLGVSSRACGVIRTYIVGGQIYGTLLRYVVLTAYVRLYVMWWRGWGHTRTHCFRRPPFGASVEIRTYIFAAPVEYVLTYICRKWSTD